MVNHLYRSRDAERYKQAQMLNDWAEQQTLPVIAVGDYNFDWEVKGGEARHDQGYDLMTADGAWKWVQPARLVTTQCSGWPCRYNSVLDFVFAAGPAQKWQAESQIVVVPGDFPDDTAKSDHRPVLARFWPAVAGQAAAAPARCAGRPGDRQPGRQFARRPGHQFPDCGRGGAGPGAAQWSAAMVPATGCGWPMGLGLPRSWSTACRQGWRWWVPILRWNP